MASSQDVKAVEDDSKCSLKIAEKTVHDLYHFRDHYFENHAIEAAVDRKTDIENEMRQVVKKLEQLRCDCEKVNKAKFSLLFGKALNVTPEFDPKALEHFGRAVKLDPKMIDAWNALGECYWKKGDVEEAKNCFEGALKHKENKVSLRELSMILRQIKGDEETKLKYIDESIKRARQAVQLDITDGMSWCILGNAYLNFFFASRQNSQLITQALKAYNQAEKDPVAKNNPDMHYNRAILHKYEEEYQLALQDLELAHALDPSWSQPPEQETELMEYLKQVHELVDKKGKTKVKKLQTFSCSLTSRQLGPYAGGSYDSSKGKSVKLEPVDLRSLEKGLNEHKVVCGRVVCNITIGGCVPFTFCIIDRNETCFSVTVYNLAQGKGVIIGDSVAIPEPYVQDVDVRHNTQEFHFRNIRVNSPLVLVVNGKKLGADKHARTEIAVSILSS